ncbi:FixH family protein [Virgibacillus sp. DJP39]|uniref:FixH family protein n=1 Tax=Virgibacillus sp. DJP39 TaxID=3409790 RepID=UPI003BB54C1C
MKKIMILILFIVFLSACGNNNEQSDSNAGVVKPIDVELKVPNKVDVGKPVTFSVTVSQNGKPIEDASEVEFEVWNDGSKSKSVKAPGIHQKEGIYTHERTFTENGIYIVQSHVTARDMHTMPKTKITVGELNTNTAESNESGDSNSNQEHQHHATTTIDLQKPEKLIQNESSKFVAIITHKENPLDNANVRVELWKDGTKKHNYVDLVEDKAGHYIKELKLEGKGTYHITVHVEKEEIHSHKEYKVEVN